MLAPDRQSVCKCNKMFIFPYPTSWRPDGWHTYEWRNYVTVTLSICILFAFLVTIYFLLQFALISFTLKASRYSMATAAM